MTTPRSLLVAAVGLAVVGGAVALQLEVGGRLAARRSQLADARATLVATEAELAAAGRSDAVVAGRLRVAQRKALRTEGELTDTSEGLIARTAERERLAASLASSSAELGGTRSQLEEVSTSSWLHGTQIADLGTCLDGVARATAGRAARDVGGAVYALEEVSTACREAEDAIAPGASPLAFPYDFADPYVLPHAGGYLAYSTNGGGGNIQVIRSRDLGSWEWVGDALPALPAWANPHFTWAPSVLPRNGGYVMYYAVRERATNRQCITQATSASATGPFVDASAGPFLCQRELGGSIDPSVFVDVDGVTTLLWKSDDEVTGGRAQLWSAPLDPSGTLLAGWPTPLLSADQDWEDRIIEGPSLARVGDRYHLFYSGSFWNSETYGIGHAVCLSPAGPCTKTGWGPALETHGTAVSSGGQEVLRDTDGGLWLAFHAWTRPNVGYPNPRTLRLERLDVANGRPVLTS